MTKVKVFVYGRLRQRRRRRRGYYNSSPDFRHGDLKRGRKNKQPPPCSGTVKSGVKDLRSMTRLVHLYIVAEDSIIIIMRKWIGHVLQMGKVRTELTVIAKKNTIEVDRIRPARHSCNIFKLLGQGYLRERLKSSPRKFYCLYGDLIKHDEVPLSQMLHDILGHDHIQWHPPLIRHFT